MVRCLELCSAGFWVYPSIETPGPIWAIYSSIYHPSQQKTKQNNKKSCSDFIFYIVPLCAWCLLSCYLAAKKQSGPVFIMLPFEFLISTDNGQHWSCLQPFLVWQILQSIYHFCVRLLDSPQGYLSLLKKLRKGHSTEDVSQQCWTEVKNNLISLDVLLLVFLMQMSILLAFFATRVRCWFIFILPSNTLGHLYKVTLQLVSLQDVLTHFLLFSL